MGVLALALQDHGLSLLAPKDPEAKDAWGVIVCSRNHWAVFRKFCQAGEDEQMEKELSSESSSVWVDLDSNIRRPRLLTDEEVNSIMAGVAPRISARGGPPLVFFVAGPMPQAAQCMTGSYLGGHRHRSAVVLPQPTKRADEAAGARGVTCEERHWTAEPDPPPSLSSSPMTCSI